jgi:high frequency lysogenization protein
MRPTADSKADYYLNITLALAGCFQAARLVQQIAHHARHDDLAFASSIHSLLKIDSSSVLDIFGGIEGLELGLKELCIFFESPPAKRERDVARYVYSLFYLERQLKKDPEMGKKISVGIQQAQRQSHHFTETHPNVILNLAEIYHETISTLSYRIQVTGDPSILNQSTHINQIRALLLAGIRSAILWRQMKGSRWQLLFFYKRILYTARELLNEPRKPD